MDMRKRREEEFFFLWGQEGERNFPGGENEDSLLSHIQDRRLRLKYSSLT